MSFYCSRVRQNAGRYGVARVLANAATSWQVKLIRRCDFETEAMARAHAWFLNSR